MSLNPNLNVEERIETIRQSLPKGTRLVAVSKYHPSRAIMEAYEAGQRVFGESRVQELMAKHEELEHICLDIVWHFIGPLQTNKVKYIAPFVGMIESVDSRRLLDEINKQALKHHRRIPILLEMHVAEEESKHGLTRSELLDLLEYLKRNAEDYSGIKLAGLMAMASFTDDKAQIAREFAEVERLFTEVKGSGLLVDEEAFTELSMGMSGDYDIAIEHGSTLVRIGSAIFGERDTNETD